MLVLDDGDVEWPTIFVEEGGGIDVEVLFSLNRSCVDAVCIQVPAHFTARLGLLSLARVAHAVSLG